MIEEPSAKTLEGVDWELLARVQKKADALHALGRLNPRAFENLWAEGLAATGDHPELLQTLDMLRPAGKVDADEPFIDIDD
jgi:hypothetical protein